MKPHHSRILGSLLALIFISTPVLLADDADDVVSSLPVAKIVATDPTALEGASSGAFTVRRQGDVHAPLTVEYEIGGTASNGVDYVLIPNSVTILAGALAADIVVQPQNVPPAPIDKTVVLTLKTNASYVIGSRKGAKVTIVGDRLNNFPPVINLVSPTNGTVITVPMVTLLAEASDSDDVVIKVSFYADDHFLGSVTNTPFSLTWSNMAAGNYTLVAKATDAAGLSTLSSGVKLIASNIPPVVSLVSPTNQSVFEQGVKITLTAEASDSNDAIRKVTFFANEHSLGSVTNPPYSLVWSNVPPNRYHLVVRATDTFGTTAKSSPVKITVTNAPPVVSLISPENDDTFTKGTPVTLTAEASDSDDAVENVSFYANEHYLGKVTKPPYTLTWKKPAPGRYTLLAKATDQYDLSALSTPVKITVNHPGKLTPAAAAAGEAGLTGQPVVYIASAERLDNGQYQLVLMGQPGAKVLIESSKNFHDWSPLATVELPDGSLEYLDAKAADQEHRFYRLLPLP